MSSDRVICREIFFGKIYFFLTETGNIFIISVKVTIINLGICFQKTGKQKKERMYEQAYGPKRQGCD